MGLPLSLNAESYTRVLGAKGGICSAFWRHRDEENAKRVVWDFLRRPCVGRSVEVRPGVTLPMAIQASASPAETQSTFSGSADRGGASRMSQPEF